MNAYGIESLWLATDDWCLRWLVTVLHFLWQGVAIGAMAILGAWLLRLRSATSRYMLYAVALVSLPACVAVTWAVVAVPESWQAAPATGEPALVVVDSRAQTAEPGLRVDADPLEPIGPMAASAVSQSPIGMASAPAPDRAETVVRDRVAAGAAAHDAPFVARIAPLLVAAYFAGALACLVRLMAALWGGHRLRSMATAVVDPTLLEIIARESRRVGLKLLPVVAYCERVAVPTVVGAMRPMVLLPVSLMTGLAPDQAAAIISHELAHIRRHDLLMNLVQRVIESLLFFHPVVWLISRRMSGEREACCDDLVVCRSSPFRWGRVIRCPLYCGAAKRLISPCLNNPSLMPLQ